MTGKELKLWMQAKEKTVIDVASATKTHPQTVQRFLDGKDVRPANKEMYRRLVMDDPIANPRGQKPTGT